MIRRTLLAVSVLCVSGIVSAQNVPTIAGEVKQNYARTKELIMRAAAKMPDDAYSFRATPDVRTFAQLIAHVSEAQAIVCGGVVGQPTRIDSTRTAKSDVIGELAKSFAVCDRAYDAITDSNLSQIGGAGFMGGTLTGRLYATLIHDNEMYGTMVVYLRLKGIVPPSSEGRGR